MRPKNVLLEDFLATLLVQFEDDSRGGDSFPIQSRFDAYAPLDNMPGQAEKNHLSIQIFV